MIQSDQIELDWFDLNQIGFKKHVLDIHSFYKHGLDKHGLDKHGLDKHSLDKQGLDKHGLNMILNKMLAVLD